MISLRCSRCNNQLPYDGLEHGIFNPPGSYMYQYEVMYQAADDLAVNHKAIDCIWKDLVRRIERWYALFACFSHLVAEVL